MVQLKLIEKVNPSHPDKDFNSIMVQLKHEVADLKATVSTNFNSIMVQLKHQVSPATFAETEISIP